jgi:hypothetical protein
MKVVLFKIILFNSLSKNTYYGFLFFYYFASILLGQISQFTICTTCYESHNFFHSFASLTRAPPSLIKLQIHEKCATFITSCTIYYFLLHQICVKSCNVLDHVSFLSVRTLFTLKPQPQLL